jgi:hypothetical protein
MKNIKRIIIHCSVSDWGNADAIRRWHVNGNGWRDIGYHYVILNGIPLYKNEYDETKDGIIEAGRPIDNDDVFTNDEYGAHTRGLNDESIGICLIGNDYFTFEQMSSLSVVCGFWKRIIPDIEIIGHYAVNPNKTCPNFDVEEFKDLIV